MSIAAKDSMLFTQARATLSELVDEVKRGRVKVITMTAKAMWRGPMPIDWDDHHRVEREHLTCCCSRT